MSARAWYWRRWHARPVEWDEDRGTWRLTRRVVLKRERDAARFSRRRAERVSGGQQ